MNDLIKVYLEIFMCFSFVALWAFLKSSNAEAVLNVFAMKYHCLPVAHLYFC